jgi:hypothetical protein
VNTTVYQIAALLVAANVIGYMKRDKAHWSWIIIIATCAGALWPIVLTWTSWHWLDEGDKR